jgi:hypothetical protein
MKKFRTNWSGIHELTVIKETDKTIWFINESGRNDTERIDGSNHSWHDTKEEAREYLIFQQDVKIKQYENNIKYCKEQIEKIKAL